MALTPAQVILLERIKTEFTKEKVTAELHRRSVQPRIQLISRWAMITRKMKKEEPSNDVPDNFTDLIKYVRALPVDVLLTTDYLSNVISLLSSNKGDEAERSAWALRTCIYCAKSIWGDDEQFKSICVSAGAIPPLVSLLSSSNKCEVQEAALALCAITRGNGTGKASLISTGAIQKLKDILVRRDKDVYVAFCASKILHEIGC